MLIELFFGTSSIQKEYAYTQYESPTNIKSLDNKSFSELLMVSEDWNGYLREKAVQKLGQAGNPLAIPKLIIRLNDWVPQVRESAVEALEELLIPTNTQAFVDNLPKLYHLKKQKRNDHRDLIKNIILFLVDPKNNESLKSAINAKDRHVARIAVSLCLEYSLLSKKEIISKCLQHTDIIVRLNASNLLWTLSGTELKSYLDIVIKDPFMPIRREALQIYLEQFPEVSHELAKKYVFDKHSSVREIAINYLQKHDFDVSDFFRKALLADDQTASHTRCAIYGLSYIDVENLEALVSKYTNHPYPSVRKSALQALSKLPNINSASYLIRGLKDESPNVAKESARLINSQRISISATQLLEITKVVNYKHTLQVCLFASKHLSKWEKLILLLSLSKIIYGHNEENNRLLDNELSKWDNAFNRSSIQPSKSELAKIKELYTTVKLLFKQKRTLLEFTLNSYKI